MDLEWFWWLFFSLYWIGCHPIFILYKIYFELSRLFIVWLRKIKTVQFKKFPPMSTAHVVIIGGGFAGTYCAQLLENDMKVTLIDTKEHFEFTPSFLRLIVQPSKLRTIQRYHRDYLKQSTTVLCGRVTRVTPYAVTIDKNRQITFDYLVIASGSHDAIPKTLLCENYNNVFVCNSSQTMRHCHNVLRLLKQKERAAVLIIGGGITGTELAAEISSDSQFRDLNIILVHSNRRLLPSLSPTASDYAYHFLMEHNVTLVLGHKVVNQIRFEHQSVFVTNMGKYLYADVAFYCANPQPSSEFMSESMSHCLDAKGWILVNEYLQLRGSAQSFESSSSFLFSSAFLKQLHSRPSTHNYTTVLSSNTNLDVDSFLNSHERPREDDVKHDSDRLTTERDNHTVSNLYRCLYNMTSPPVNRMVKLSQCRQPHSTQNEVLFRSQQEEANAKFSSKSSSSSTVSKFTQSQSALSSLRDLQRTEENSRLKNSKNNRIHNPDKSDVDIFIAMGRTPSERSPPKEEIPFPSQLSVSETLTPDKDTVIYPNIFVCGDVAATKSEKYAQYAEMEAEIVAHNILQLENRKSHRTKLRPWNTPVHRVVVSLGKYDGLLIWGNVSVRGIFAAMTKEFIEWKSMVRYWKWIQLPVMGKERGGSFVDAARTISSQKPGPFTEFKKIDL
jgi:NADH dehydrogenase FAD-containing subunit